MIKFKVIRGSSLLLGIAVALLVVVLSLLAVQYLLKSSDAEVMSAADQVTAELYWNEAEAHEASASSLRKISIEVLKSESVPTVTVRSVLVYHTHTHEAYSPEEGDNYKAIEAWRTDDADHSVVRVGAELASLLDGYGFEAVHDTTDHEQDDLGSAYLRSEETLRGYDRTFDLYIDLHRDAYTDGMRTTYTGDDGTEMAPLMMLVGRGDGFASKPDYARNLEFAQNLTDAVNARADGLCRDVLVKKNRYNQHIGTPSVLIEVGSNANTLRQALASMPALAQALSEVLQ